MADDMHILPRTRTTDHGRDDTLSHLRDGLARGAINQAEFEARTQRALTIPTYNELKGLTSDLPAPLPAPHPPVSMWPYARRLAGWSLLATVPGGIPATLITLCAVFGGFNNGPEPAGAVAMGVVGIITAMVWFLLAIIFGSVKIGDAMSDYRNKRERARW